MLLPYARQRRQQLQAASRATEQQTNVATVDASKQANNPPTNEPTAANKSTNTQTNQPTVKVEVVFNVIDGDFAKELVAPKPAEPGDPRLGVAVAGLVHVVVLSEHHQTKSWLGKSTYSLCLCGVALSACGWKTRRIE